MGAREWLAGDERLLAAQWLREYLAPPALVSCSDWADAYREIVKGPERGKWRTSRTPYLRKPMACTDPEHPAQLIVLMFATQMGKTEVLYNAVFKRIQLQPCDMLFVQPTLQDAKDHSRQRFMPTARKMPPVAARLPQGRSRDETNTWQTKEIQGDATLFFAGANSARSLASKPLGFGLGDEIDGWPLDVDGEGDPVGLIRERMSNFPDRKLVLASTPTLKDFSRIEAEYLASDRQRYHVPCPHCGVAQQLEWGATTEWGLKWLKTPDGAPRAETAVYICRHCGAAIAERHKTDMLAQGDWVAERPGAQRGLVAGFQLSKLYSPLGWKSWAMLVEDWAKAREAERAGDVAKLKTFVNTSLAETWEESGDKASEHELRRRAADVPLRVVHWGHCALTLGVDVQGDRLHLGLWARGPSQASQLVDRAVIYGDPAVPESEEGSPWRALTEYRRTPILHASGKPVRLLATLIDSGGHHTQAVYAYARAHQHANVLAGKGASQPGKPIIGKPSSQDVNWRGTRLKRGVKLWPVGTDTAKSDIYGRLRITAPGAGYVTLSKHLHPETFDQLTSERLVTRYVKGYQKLEWAKPAGRRNEDLDCAVYALAASHWAGVERWSEHDWRRHMAEVEVRDLFDQAPPAPAQPAAASDGSAPPADPPTRPAPPKPAPTPPPPQPPRQSIASPEWSNRL